MSVGYDDYSAIIDSIYTKCAIYYGIFQGYVIFETDLYTIVKPCCFCVCFYNMDVKNFNFSYLGKGH